MNWYKQAQQLTQIQPQDIISFYLFTSLSNESIKSNMELLLPMIDTLNKMKNIYLDYLKKEIAEELQHAFGYEFDQTKMQNHPAFERRDLETKINWELKQEVIDGIHKVLNSLDNNQISITLIQDVKYFFNFLPWDEAYGGKLWAEITEWLWKLYNTPAVNKQDLYMGDINAVMKDFRQLSYVLDTIHSLYHNNALVLCDLESGKWLLNLLDLAKYSSNPMGIAFFSNNPALAHLVKREQLLTNLHPQHRCEFLQETIKNIYGINENDRESKIEYFVEHLEYTPLLKTLIHCEINDFPYIVWYSLLSNEYLWEDMQSATFLVKKLYDYFGEQIISHLEDGFDTFYFEHRKPLSPGNPLFDYLVELNNLEMDKLLLKFLWGYNGFQAEPIIRKYEAQLLNETTENIKDNKEIIIRLLAILNFYIMRAKNIIFPTDKQKATQALKNNKSILYFINLLQKYVSQSTSDNQLKERINNTLSQIP